MHPELAEGLHVSNEVRPYLQNPLENFADVSDVKGVMEFRRDRQLFTTDALVNLYCCDCQYIC